MTVRQLMKLVIFAAFASLGPLPLLRPWQQSPRRGSLDAILFMTTFGLVMACLTCLIPAFFLLKGRMRLWVIRVLLCLACLTMFGTFTALSWNHILPDTLQRPVPYHSQFR